MSATFGWQDTATALHEFAFEADPRVDHARGRFVLEPSGATFTPPLVQRIETRDRSVADYLARLDAEKLGTTCVVLMRAGAASLGIWHDDENLAHKVIKKYVVRGNGRAQPTHLESKGKSRYGSRLRLQNAKRLLEQTSERLNAWWNEFGAFEGGVFVAAPVRLWADLIRVQPLLPFDPESVIRIPLDVREPGFKELVRIRRKIVRGRVAALPDDASN